MTNKVILAINEYMKDETKGAYIFMVKYDLTPTEFWDAFKSMKIKGQK